MIREEPACWSWPVPDLVTVETLLAEQAGRPLAGRRTEQDIRFMLTLPGWRAGDRFIDFHAGRCAICGRNGAEVLDHCHVTGQVRGYLDRSCNALEGKSGAVLLENYRRRHPAAILGYYAPYTGVGWHHGWNLVEHRADAYKLGPRPVTPWRAGVGE